MAEHVQFMTAVEKGLSDAEAGRMVEDTELDSKLEEAFHRGAKR
jgi:predicted transcriptional regulator